MRNANIQWLKHWQTPGINAKRPYGDMTCFYLDMAAILGVPISKKRAKCEKSFTKEQIKVFDNLHEEMFFVLQAYLQFAEVELGSYFREDVDQQWKKLASKE